MPIVDWADRVLTLHVMRRFIWNSTLMAMTHHQRLGRQFRERQRRKESDDGTTQG